VQLIVQSVRKAESSKIDVPRERYLKMNVANGSSSPVHPFGQSGFGIFSVRPALYTPSYE
jgi:hypothetical protein